MKHCVARVLLATSAAAIFAGGCGSGVETSGEESIYSMAAIGDVGRVIGGLEAGFDVNTPDSAGRTLLHHAIEAGQAPMVEALIVSYRADGNLADAQGVTAIDLALQLANPAVLEVLYNEGLVTY